MFRKSGSFFQRLIVAVLVFVALATSGFDFLSRRRRAARARV
jgi:hypothetical protein